MAVVSHNPSQCKDALAHTVSPVVVDLETTGLGRNDRIVSAGLLIDGVAYVLFARSMHASIKNISLDQFYDALQPLTRPDLVVIAHNAVFDLGFLRREGITVQGEVRDTLKLLKLIDQDRGREGGKGSGIKMPRRDLAAPEQASLNLNYKLKDVVGQLLGIRMKDFPGQIELAPYDVHARYLASDLLGTLKLYEYLWPKLTPVERTYYQALVSPLIHVLVGMTDLGVLADPAFAVQEAHKLDELMKKLSKEHRDKFGVVLKQITREQLSDWLFNKLGLPVLQKQRYGRKWVASLDNDTLKQLGEISEDEKAKGSLQIIQDYRAAASLLVRLRSLPPHVDGNTGRVHSKFDDSQASGRVSSTYPNLQQLAKAKKLCGVEYVTRNFLRASPGYELAVFDIGQADIRVLAHMVESFGITAEDHRAQLKVKRRQELETQIGEYYWQKEAKLNPAFNEQHQGVPYFSPDAAPDLATDFADPKGDFYTLAAKRFLNREPADKAERNRFKNIILSIVNGQGPSSLAKTLKCTKVEAADYLKMFDQVYPKVAAYKQLMSWQIAYTGQTETFMGRRRTVTAHRWMVAEPRVQLLVSYRDADAYWLDVVPLEPSLRVLTTWVLKAWNARTGKLIYDHQRGRLSGKWYKLFEEGQGQYLLPVRNWGWRSIRRVRCKNEEASYEGFEATARSAFNFICQGGTADVCKIMMLRSGPVCQQFDARLLLQIHDELVFEVPDGRVDQFFKAMMHVLQQPPTPGFMVPIKVEAKRGVRFGELKGVEFD